MQRREVDPCDELTAEAEKLGMYPRRESALTDDEINGIYNDGWNDAIKAVMKVLGERFTMPAPTQRQSTEETSK
jgi:hypothetical protein